MPINMDSSAHSYTGCEGPKWLEDAFYSDSKVIKNLALRRAFDEIKRLNAPAQGSRPSPDYEAAARALGFRQMKPNGKWWAPDPLWHPSYVGRWDTAEAIFASWGPAASSPASGYTVPAAEIERLRAVALAAQGMLNADTYVLDIPREQAVREATLKLQRALGTWQMHHTAQSAISSTERRDV